MYAHAPCTAGHAVAPLARQLPFLVHTRMTRPPGCPPPYIVKPVVACGTADSHSMALVLWAEALAGLPLPLPAVVQEFVNHDALIHKVYVAGDKVRVRGVRGGAEIRVTSGCLAWIEQGTCTVLWRGSRYGWPPYSGVRLACCGISSTRATR